MAFEDLNVGDETRRNGDYVGLAHDNDDGSELADADPQPGVPVTYDGTIAAADADDDEVVGVLQDYDVYGDYDNQKISDNDATVKTSGTVKANLSEMVSSGISEGEVLGANGELYILEVIDTDGGDDEIAEVLIR